MSKKTKTAPGPGKKKSAYSYCSACGCRLKINGVCRSCGSGSFTKKLKEKKQNASATTEELAADTSKED